MTSTLRRRLGALGGSIFSGRELPLDSPDRPAATVTFPAGTTVLSVPNGIGLDGMQGQGNVFCFPVVDGKPDLTKQGLVHLWATGAPPAASWTSMRPSRSASP